MVIGGKSTLGRLCLQNHFQQAGENTDDYSLVSAAVWIKSSQRFILEKYVLLMYRSNFIHMITGSGSSGAKLHLLAVDQKCGQVWLTTCCLAAV